MGTRNCSNEFKRPTPPDAVWLAVAIGFLGRVGL